MSDDHNPQPSPQNPTPNPDLRSLDKLVGTWTISGPSIHGQVTYTWMEGGFFLIQNVDFVQDGRPIKGIEIIGHEQNFGASEPSPYIRSRWFDNEGNTFDYTYEVDDETLTIWGGEKGSPAYYKGRWNADGSVNAGEWVYPGGGYESTMTRIK